MPDAEPEVRLGAPSVPIVHPGLGALFAGFFGIGIVGFGGVLPWARRMLVEQRGWLSPAEFNDTLALCQFLPGPNIVNMAVAIGARFHGALGSATCLVGLLAAPLAIVMLLGSAYSRLDTIPVVMHAFGGLAAAASGLVVSMAVKVAVPLRAQWLGIAVAVVMFVAIAILRMPLLTTVLVLVPASVLLRWRWPS